MSLPRISIQNPVMGWMVTLALFIFGAFALKNLGVSQYPDVDFPVVSVSVGVPGASPELIETDVVEILESALSSVEGVQRISSRSSFGSASVTLEFSIDKNIDTAVNEVSVAVGETVRRLPDGIEAPVVRKTNPEDRPLIWLSLSGPGTRRELMNIAKTRILDQLTTIEGVGDVTLGGFLEPVIRVWLNPEKLKNFDLTYEDILTALNTDHKEIPIGQMIREKDEIGLRFKGEATTLKEIESITISRRSGALLWNKITIGELGRVEAGLEDARRFARNKGKLSVGFGIRKQRGENSIAVVDRIKERIKTLQLPKDYEIGVRFDTTLTIRHSIRELIFTLGLSVVLTALVCWLFLGSWVATFNISIAIPTSLFATFIFMSWAGYTLNIFTMLALILSVGIIVDDAIMVLENIYRHREFDPDPRSSALKGAQQVQFAAVATTLAIIAIFIPVVFVSGVVGKYLAQFGIVLSVAVAVSTFEALSFTPMRLSSQKGEQKLSGIPKAFDLGVQRLANSYAKWAAKNLNLGFKKTAYYYLVALLTVGAAFFVAKKIPSELVPTEETGTFMVRAELPLGTSLEETGRRLQPVEEYLSSVEGVRSVYAIVGDGGVNFARLMIALEDKNFRKASQIEIETRIRRESKRFGDDLKLRIQSSGGISIGGGHRGYPIEMSLQGSNWEELIEASENLAKALENDGRFVDVDTSFDPGFPEFQIIPNREQAFLHGVGIGQLSESLAFIFQGLKAGKFTDEGRRVEIIVKADPKLAPQTIPQLENLYVRNFRGQLVRLDKLVDVKKAQSPVSIAREDRSRTVTVNANLEPGFFSGPALEEARRIAANMLPVGVRVNEKLGTSGGMGQTFRDLFLALGMGALVAYMVLASQFNSYLNPLIVLLVLPLSLAGAFFAFALSGATLNLFSMIGLLLLMGIVKKNSIMLVEFAEQGIHSKLSVVDAMVEACRTRFRPILMTALTTLTAALPPALKIGSDTEASASMSIGIVGGVLLSTLLTFFVIPLAYVHLRGWRRISH